MFSKKKIRRQNKAQVATLKEDCVLFSRLYIACQSREGNLQDFFQYENQPWPPSLAKLGEMRSGNKAELLVQLETLGTVPEVTPSVTAMIMDGAMIAQMLVPGTPDTFSDYVNCVSSIYSLPIGQCSKTGCSLGCLHS